MTVSVGLRRVGAVAVSAATFAATLMFAPPPAAAVGPGDHILYWNEVLRSTFRLIGGAPGPLARAGAIMHVAMYDAANSVRCAERLAACLGRPYLIQVPGGGDFNTAIDYAAYRTLDGVFNETEYPESRFPGVSFDDELAFAQAGIPNSPGRTAGISIGTQAANAILQDRANDGYNASPAYTPDGVPGAWFPLSGATQDQAATPHWGNLRPFTMTSGSQFRPELPAGATSYATLLGTSAYAEQLQEVRDYGAKNSSVRTADQTEAAWFWANDLDGTYKPPGQIFDHTQTVVEQEGLSVDSEVKLFAQVALAMADAAILAWDSKYNTPIDLWRPVHAIRFGSIDPDPNWQPLSTRTDGSSFTPPFPAYVSGHSTFAYAWAEVMRHWFATDNISFTGGTDDPHLPAGSQRHFHNFTEAADENAHSRLWLGVHFHFDADNVLNPGTELGNYAAHARLGPNQSDVELLYVRRTDATSRFDCDNLGEQLVNNEHRWTRYRCVWIQQYTTFELYVR